MGRGLRWPPVPPGPQSEQRLSSLQDDASRGEAPGSLLPLPFARPRVHVPSPFSLLTFRVAPQSSGRPASLALEGDPQPHPESGADDPSQRGGSLTPPCTRREAETDQVGHVQTRGREGPGALSPRTRRHGDTPLTGHGGHTQTRE